MVNRRPLRAALRGLIAPLGKRILVVQDANPPPETVYSRKSGKAHTIQLISFLSTVSGAFEFAWIDLGSLGTPNRLIQPNDLARSLVRKLNLDEAILPPQPSDAQWSYWVTDFCDRFESPAKSLAESWWIVIGGFNRVPLPQPTLDLVKAIAMRINVTLPRLRLVLLGYNDTFPPEVMPNVEPEKVERSISDEDLIGFFDRAARERSIQPSADRVAELTLEVVDGLDTSDLRYLEILGQRLSERVAKLTAGPP